MSANNDRPQSPPRSQSPTAAPRRAIRRPGANSNGPGTGTGTGDDDASRPSPQRTASVRRPGILRGSAASSRGARATPTRTMTGGSTASGNSDDDNRSVKKTRSFARARAMRSGRDLSQRKLQKTKSGSSSTGASWRRNTNSSTSSVPSHARATGSSVHHRAVAAEANKGSPTSSVPEVQYSRNVRNSQSTAVVRSDVLDAPETEFDAAQMVGATSTASDDTSGVRRGSGHSTRNNTSVSPTNSMTDTRRGSDRSTRNTTSNSHFPNTESTAMSTSTIQRTGNSSHRSLATADFLDEDPLGGSNRHSNIASGGRQLYSTAVNNRTSSYASLSNDDNADTTLGSTFLSRPDLREVDQSVNLMSGQYIPDATETNRASRKRGRKKPRNSVMEIFFNDQGDTTKVHRRSMMDIDLGVGPSKGRKSMFAIGGIGSGNSGFQQPIWFRVEECCESVWDIFKRIFCNISFLLVLLMTIFCASLIVLVTRIDMGSVHFPTPPLAPKTPSPSTAPAPAPTPPITTANLPPAMTSNDSPASTGMAVSDTEPETVESRLDAIQSLIAELGISRPEDLEDPNSASSRAIRWLAEFDPAFLALATTPQAMLLERYAAATFYFLAKNDLSPSNVEVIPSAQTIAAGRQLENSDLFFLDWMSGDSVCRWHGVSCRPSQHRVIAFNQTKAGISGLLPTELAVFGELLELDLSHNFFEATIPTEWGHSLTNLRYLLINDNALTGTLPDSLGELTALYDLDLGSNQFTGTLPASVSNLSQLRLLFLDNNKFSGSIPANIGSLAKVEYFDLSNNDIGGELPYTLFSKLKNLVDLRLGANDLTGTIPPEIESLHRLSVVRLESNRIRGQLPDVFDRLHYLEQLDLQDNLFSGTLPVSIGQLALLEHLYLSDNSFTGIVPHEWGSLSSIEILEMQNNSVTGLVPSEVCALKTGHNLGLIHADCEQILCSCCDLCGR